MKPVTPSSTTSGLDPTDIRSRASRAPSPRTSLGRTAPASRSERGSPVAPARSPSTGREILLWAISATPAASRSSTKFRTISARCGKSRTSEGLVEAGPRPRLIQCRSRGGIRAESAGGFAFEAAPHRRPLSLPVCGQGHRLLATRANGNGTGTRHGFDERAVGREQQKGFDGCSEPRSTGARK